MNKLRIQILLAALLALPTVGMQAREWMPYGETHEASEFSDLTTFALNGDGDYEVGDVIFQELDGDPNTSVQATIEGFSDSAEESDNILNIYGTLNGVEYDEYAPEDICPLKIDGDVYIATAADTRSDIPGDMTVNIKTPVIFEPYWSAIAPLNEAATFEGNSIIFETVKGRTITVNVDHDLTFRGLTSDDDKRDLFLVFKGAGQTVFKMADGTVIKFDGQMDESTPLEIDPETGLLVAPEVPEFSAYAGGTKVFVLMDQTKAEVEAGQNKVLFERVNNLDVNGKSNLRTMIYIGTSSVFTYLSNNYQGFDGQDVDPDYSVFEEGGAYYAAVGVDPSNPFGTGRMVLFIKGAYKTGWQDGLVGGENPDPMYLKLVKKFPFNDGALVVSGHFVGSLDDYEQFRTPQIMDTEDPYGFDFSAPAGVKAIFRVVDNKNYAEATKPFALDAENRRGLLVINDCQNVGKYAADPYWDSYNGSDYAGGVWAYLNSFDVNVRTGFVLGINGVLDVYDSAFVDYIAGAPNEYDYAAVYDFGADYTKKRNPSALIVDGFDQSISALDHPFYAADKNYYGEKATQPEILLRGNAKILFKAAATATTPFMYLEDTASGFGPGYLYNFWVYDEAYAEEYDPIADPEIDWNVVFAAGNLSTGIVQKATYNGYQLQHLTNDYSFWNYTTAGQGEIVLDVEGPLAVKTVSNNTIMADPYAATPVARENAEEAVTKTGSISLAPLLTDYAGREINIVNQISYFDYQTELVTRPLVVNSTSYARYNSPAIMLNDHMSVYNTIINHNDVTKFVFTSPDLSEPALVGGERMFFASSYYPGIDDVNSDPARYRYPEFRLYNSELALHESLCASGVRFVTMDEQFKLDTTGSNTSVIRFYDHGQSVDAGVTGYGRVLMLGSDLNLMAGGFANYVTSSAFMNVFKRNVPQITIDETGVIDNSSKVKLSLRNGNEFAADVPVTQYERQRSQHYICMGIASQQSSAKTGIFVGWPTVADYNEDGVLVPCASSNSFPYPGEVFGAREQEEGANSQLVDVAWFNLDSLTADQTGAEVEVTQTPAARAELSFDGTGICVTARDAQGNGPLLPVASAADSGNVYVDFGGKLVVSKYQEDVVTTPRYAQHKYNDVGFETTIATRLWNDFDFDGLNRLTWYSGIVDLPSTQVEFAKNYGIQPYGFAQSMVDANAASKGFVRLPTTEEMNIGWFYRDVAFPQINKRFDAGQTPITRPDYMPYIGAGSDVQQMRISGATPTDPFYMDITGDGIRAKVARVRELSTLHSTRTHRFIGEGQHGVIFAEFGGRFGLGSTEWNDNSSYAWNVLGQDFVSLAPMGHCTVDINEDIIIADDLPFIPVMNKDEEEWGFGYDFTGEATSHRMTLRSDVEREIRVIRGAVLDLSGFGQGNIRQEIAFGGKVKLVFEEGSGIRFPSNPSAGLVLYFNDNSQCIFEGVNEATLARYDDAVASDENRIRIMGKGQIWLNKSAQLNIMGTASVSVCTDATSPATDVTISLQRESQFNIGSVNLAGGTFQVGDLVAQDDHSIAFSLLINGANAVFHTDREGFFGLGAGIINKLSSKPNGSAQLYNDEGLMINPQILEGETTINPDINTGYPIFSGDEDIETGTAWQVIPLYNVANVTVGLQHGIIEHRNIADGSSSDASLWAIGNITQGVFQLNNRANASVRGGGNIMFVPATLPEDSIVPYVAVNMWDYAGPMINGEEYSVLASGPLLIGSPAESTAVYDNQGRAFAFASGRALYDLVCFAPLAEIAGARYVSLGSTQFGNAAAYVNNAQAGEKYAFTDEEGNAVAFPTIYRIANPVAVVGQKTKDALPAGALAIRGDSSANPTEFAVADLAQ